MNTYIQKKEHIISEIGRFILLGLLLPLLLLPINVSCNGEIGFLCWQGYVNLIATHRTLHIACIVVLLIMLTLAMIKSRLRIHPLAMSSILFCILYLLFVYIWSGWLLILCIFFAAMLLDEPSRLIVKRWIVFYMLLQIFVGLLAFLINYNQFKTPEFGYRASGLYRTPLEYGPVCLFAVSLFTPLCLLQTDWNKKLLSAAVACLSYIVLVLTFTRSEYIGTCAILLMIRRLVPNIRLSVIIIAILVITGGAFLLRANGDVKNIWNDKSTISRSIIWKSTVNDIRRNILLGHIMECDNGVRDQADFELKKKSLGKSSSDPNNLFLYICQSTGLIGFILFAYFIVSNIRTTNRLINSRTITESDRVMAHTCRFMNVATLISGMFSTPILSPTTLPSTACFMLITGMVCSIDISYHNYSQVELKSIKSNLL